MATKTITEGCLANFPSVSELQGGLSSKKAAEELYHIITIIQKLKTSGRNVTISYLELCMMYCFSMHLANRLMVACEASRSAAYSEELSSVLA